MLQSLEENHKKLSAVSTPLLANEDTLNSYLRDYNIRVEKMNEAHDAIDRHANRLVDHIKVGTPCSRQKSFSLRRRE